MIEIKTNFRILFENLLSSDLEDKNVANGNLSERDLSCSNKTFDVSAAIDCNCAMCWINFFVL